ncbi:SpoIIE family protein phosphatase [Actinokineospora soli]|uniref:SpoIIE family protein phosphatase n=1 Tax=Actinokineospora soli TaxID=1048753 RepID=A0ABW2TLM6_9PSEU
MLVGAFPQATFTKATTRLHPGDTLLLHTDGLTEARTGRTRYGEDNLLEFLTAAAPCAADELIDALAALLDDFGDGVDDDTALLALGVPGFTPANS